MGLTSWVVLRGAMWTPAFVLTSLMFSNASLKPSVWRRRYASGKSQSLLASNMEWSTDVCSMLVVLRLRSACRLLMKRRSAHLTPVVCLSLRAHYFAYQAYFLEFICRISHIFFAFDCKHFHSILILDSAPDDVDSLRHRGRFALCTVKFRPLTIAASA